MTFLLWRQVFNLPNQNHGKLKTCRHRSVVARGWRSLALAVRVGGACPGGLRQAKPSALLPGISSPGHHDTYPLIEAGVVLPACLQQHKRC